MSESSKSSGARWPIYVAVVVVALGGLFAAAKVLGWLKARSADNFRDDVTRGQIVAIANACDAYYTYYDAHPGPVADPPGHADGEPPKISGSQNLRLSLLGASIDADGNIREEYQGPASDARKYDQPDARIYEAFYTPSDRELVAHNSVYNGGDPNYRGSIEVLVDHRSPDPRPILYYRARPTYTSGPRFDYEDNEIYCDPSKGETKAAFDAFVARRPKAAGAGFLLISAGADRRYFTDDDITNVFD